MDPSDSSSEGGSKSTQSMSLEGSTNSKDNLDTDPERSSNSSQSMGAEDSTESKEQPGLLDNTEPEEDSNPTRSMSSEDSTELEEQPGLLDNSEPEYSTESMGSEDFTESQEQPGLLDNIEPEGASDSTESMDAEYSTESQEQPDNTESEGASNPTQSMSIEDSTKSQDQPSTASLVPAASEENPEIAAEAAAKAIAEAEHASFALKEACQVYETNLKLLDKSNTMVEFAEEIVSRCASGEKVFVITKSEEASDPTQEQPGLLDNTKLEVSTTKSQDKPSTSSLVPAASHGKPETDADGAAKALAEADHAEFESKEACQVYETNLKLLDECNTMLELAEEIASCCAKGEKIFLR